MMLLASHPKSYIPLHQLRILLLSSSASRLTGHRLLLLVKNFSYSNASQKNSTVALSSRFSSEDDKVWIQPMVKKFLTRIQLLSRNFKMALPPADTDTGEAEHSWPLEVMPREHLALLLTSIDRHKNTFHTAQRWYASKLPSIPGFSNVSLSTNKATSHLEADAVDFSPIASYAKEQRAEALKQLIFRIPPGRFSEAILKVLKESIDDETIWLDKPKKPPAVKSTLSWYLSKQIKIFTKKNPGMDTHALTSQFSEAFKQLSDEKREKYERQRKEALSNYEAQMTEYNARIKAIHQRKRGLPESYSNVNGNTPKKRKHAKTNDDAGDSRAETKTDVKQEERLTGLDEVAAIRELKPPKTPFALFKERMQQKHTEAVKEGDPENHIQLPKPAEIQREWNALKKKKKLRYINTALPDIDRYYVQVYQFQEQYPDAAKSSVKSTALDPDRLLTGVEKDLFADRMDLKRPVANGYQVFTGLRREQVAQEKEGDQNGGEAQNDDAEKPGVERRNLKFERNRAFLTECATEWKQMNAAAKAPYNKAAADARKAYEERLQQYIMSLPVDQREGASLRLNCHALYMAKWRLNETKAEEQDEAVESDEIVF